MRWAAILGLFAVFAALLATSAHESDQQPIVGMPALDIDYDE